MKISALIAEFNPIHKGHRLLIDAMREKSDAVISIMSGNFVQRGECSIYEKSQRSISAVENGVDLCISLPSVYALSSAEGFARGGVEILDGCGVVNELWFGSECGSLDSLKKVSDAIDKNTDTFRERLSEKLKEGFSYPYARQYALEAETDCADILSSPNNTLGIEYIRALNRIKSTITPVTIKRLGSGYNDDELSGSLSSASAIRKAIRDGKDISSATMFDFDGSPMFLKDLDMICSARLKTISCEELTKIPDCNSEIASRLKDASVFNTIEEIIENASCKSYTISRLRRVLCNMMISNTFKELPSPTYIQPLAFNKTGAKILKYIKEKGTLPVFDRGALLKDDDIFALECRATDIYNLPRGIRGGGEITRKVNIL